MNNLFKNVSRIVFAIIMIAAMLSMVSVSPVSAQSGDNPGVAWQNDNQSDGSTYGEAPVGGLRETRWITGQTWWGPARSTFAIRPGCVIWFSGHLGGTGWYLAGDEAAARADIAQQAADLELRDGPMETIQVVLPDDMVKLPIAVRYTCSNTSGTTTTGTTTGTTAPAVQPATQQLANAGAIVVPTWNKFWSSDFGRMLWLILRIAIVAAAVYLAWSMGRGFWGKVLTFGVAAIAFALLLTLGDLGWVLLGGLVVLFLLWLRNLRFHNWVTTTFRRPVPVPAPVPARRRPAAATHVAVAPAAMTAATATLVAAYYTAVANQAAGTVTAADVAAAKTAANTALVAAGLPAIP